MNEFYDGYLPDEELSDEELSNLWALMWAERGSYEDIY